MGSQGHKTSDFSPWSWVILKDTFEVLSLVLEGQVLVSLPLSLKLTYWVINTFYLSCKLLHLKF